MNEEIKEQFAKIFHRLADLENIMSNGLRDFEGAIQTCEDRTDEVESNLEEIHSRLDYFADDSAMIRERLDDLRDMIIDTTGNTQNNRENVDLCTFVVRRLQDCPTSDPYVAQLIKFLIAIFGEAGRTDLNEEAIERSIVGDVPDENQTNVIPRRPRIEYIEDPLTTTASFHELMSNTTNNTFLNEYSDNTSNE